MKVKKYNPFVVKHKHQPIPQIKTKPKPKTKLEAKGLSLDNKKKIDIIYAKNLLRLVGTSSTKIITITLTITMNITLTTRLYQTSYYQHD